MGDRKIEPERMRLRKRWMRPLESQKKKEMGLG